MHSTGFERSRHFLSGWENNIAGRLVKNDEMQGARNLRNEAYLQYAAMTKDEAQHNRSRLSPACRMNSEDPNQRRREGTCPGRA